MSLLKKHIINSENIELKEMLKDISDFRDSVVASLRSGDKTFLPNIAAKEFGAYKNPSSQQSVKAVFAWNLIHSDQTIELPAKVSALKLNIFDEDDILPLKETHPDIYNIIMDKIFNDETGIFVQKTWNPGVNYVNPKKEDWYKDIPEKYRTKYKKLGAKAWNDFVDTYDFDSPGAFKGEWILKKSGLQVLAIPSNQAIPEWCQPYIDMSTIVNNIIAPFLPVLEIFQTQTLEEGKTRKGVNRKTKTFSNIVKF